MDELFFEDKIYTDYADLAAVGIIADVMDMRDTDNNAIAYQGLNNIQNGFLLALMDRHKFRLGEKDYLTRNDVAFYIAPTINGTIRGGSPEDKEYVFRSMAGLYDSTQEFAYDGKFETFDQRAVRLASNAKSRQDAAKKKAFEWISDKIRSEGLDADNIIIVPLTEKESLKLANNIRKLGFKVDIEMCNKKLKKSLSFANKENIPFVIILGEDEIKNKCFYYKTELNTMFTSEELSHSIGKTRMVLAITDNGFCNAIKKYLGGVENEG